jgi:hypothetical protein
MQLTDDSIDGFISDIVDYLERTPLTFNEKGEVTDEGYDHLNEFIYNCLSRYSNGYKNFN